jgi:hypothetical protein
MKNITQIEYIRPRTRQDLVEQIEAFVLDYYATLSSGVRTYSKEHLREEAKKLVDLQLPYILRDIRLTTQYLEEFIVIDGLSQHKDGMSFAEYCAEHDKNEMIRLAQDSRRSLLD